jgi:hypothetical protein
MKLRNQNIVVTLEGAVDWGGDHPLLPLNPRVTALYTNIGASAAAIRSYSTDQDSGGAEFHAATRTRREIADALLVQMRPISKMAKELPRDLYPGVRGLFLMPTSHGYAALISRADSFLEAIGPVKAAFVERGLPADFDEQLAAAFPPIGSASLTRTLGKAEQVGGTAGIAAKASEGLMYLRELDSILSYLYRNDPALLASWKSVRHVPKDPVREQQAPTAASNAGPPALPDAKATAAESAPRSNEMQSSFGGVEPRTNGTNGGLAG